MKNILTLAIVLAILGWVVFLNTHPAFAQSCPVGTPVSDCGSGGGGGATGPTPAPAPIAGAGLIYLVAAGGYYAVRRWRSTSKNKL